MPLKTLILLRKTFFVLLAVSLLFTSCDFFADGEKLQEKEEIKFVTSLKLSKATLELKVGSIEYISYTYAPKEAFFLPDIDYDESKINVRLKNNGLIIEGLSEGQTDFTISSGNSSATCIINISGFEQGYEETVEPYIYSNTNILQMSPGLSEKVFVSLYGGTAADINDYTWSAEDNTICKLEPTGQYCMINALGSGYTRIKVTHSKAPYPYYMGCYVFEDPTKETYITTTNNVLTMNQNDSEQNISVSLVNALESSLDSSFKWEIINSVSDDTENPDSENAENPQNNSESSSETTTKVESKTDNCPIELSYNGANAVITPKHGGSCTVRVTHPDATYPLDILCRVITVIKNVYINPDVTMLTLDGDKEMYVTSTLVNLGVGEYDLSEYSYEIENEDVAEIISQVENTVYLKGLKNGSTKLVISHPKAEYSREVLLISTNQIANAVDVSCYITTSQNYIRTKVGSSPSEINISLKGGEDGDENDFCWTVLSSAADGSNNDVISLETPTGSVFNANTGRMAQSTFAYGNAVVTPLCEGTAVITLTHKKVLYPTEILIKVLSKDAILEEPLYLKGDGLVRILNGESQNYTVTLSGNSKTIADVQNIAWSIDDERIKVAGNEDKALITAPSHGTGSTISHMSISHPKVDSPKSVLVMTADDEETLMNMKALYTDKNYYNIEVGSSVHFSVYSVGFDEDYDYSLMDWKIDNSGIIELEVNSEDKRFVSVTALKSGTAKLTAKIEDCTCVYTMTVYPVGAVQTEPEVYFTTMQNVIVFNEINSAKTAKVTPVNMNPASYSAIQWSSSDTTVCNVIPNGASASLTALKEGDAIISVTHPDSQNTLKIYVKVGNEYIIQPANDVYISSSTDVVTLLRDDSPQMIQAVLVNYSGNDGENFEFTSEDTSIASVSSQSENGVAFVTPVASGQTEIVISNPVSSLTKKILVVVGNSAEELAGVTYLTTPNNVVSIGEGKTRSVSVSVKNSTDIVIDGYSWTSSDMNIADVTSAGDGSSASIKGNKQGTAIITVTNTLCKFPLQIIVHVVDPIAASEHPFVQLSSSVLLLTVDNSYTSLSADLVGGSESDYSDFVWTSNDSEICNVFGQNEVGKLKAVKAGTTYITVSHPKADYSAQLLVVCDNKKQNECYISVPSSILNMKPSDTSTTVTASLVNGTANDKYNFKWQVDVYDIVDIAYSANVCTITPKQTGSATITISHPKADYDQQIIVTVSQYTNFAFPSTNITLTEGDVKFMNMEVPVTSAKTYIEYSVENDKVCVIEGTKQVAQIRALKKGTTTVHATLKATVGTQSTVQGTADLMVYVKERPSADVDAYITASSTVFTVKKGKQQTLSASLVGSTVVASDQSTLTWSTSNASVVSIAGLGSAGNVKGQTIYITAKSAGEAIITCSHSKATSNLQFYVVVPADASKVITLNKSYVTITKGSSGAQLTASIQNAESNDDYNNLTWTCTDSVASTNVARVMGSGKNVMIYPINTGECVVSCSLTGTTSVAKCTVSVEAGKSFNFETTGTKVVPGGTATVNYTVSPPNAVVNWVLQQDDTYIKIQDNGANGTSGKGTVTITGVKEGNCTILATSDGGCTGRISVSCGYNFSFGLSGKTSFNITPTGTHSISYSVNPVDSEIVYDSALAGSKFSVSVSKNLGADKKPNGTGTITITPTTECKDKITITLYAKYTPTGGETRTFGTQKVEGYIKYSALTTSVSAAKRNSGKWSAYNTETNTITLGDGETMEVTFKLNESKCDGSISDIKLVGATRNGYQSSLPSAYCNGNTIYIDGGNDYKVTQKMYKVNNLYIDSRYPDMSKFKWQVCYYTKKPAFSNTQYCDFLRLIIPDGDTSFSQAKQYESSYMMYDDSGDNPAPQYRGIKKVTTTTYPNAGPSSQGDPVVVESIEDEWMDSENNLVENTAYSGTYMTESEVKNNPWLYCPGSIEGNKDTVFSQADIDAGTYKNGKFGTNDQVNVTPHVLTSHLIADLVDVTSADDTVIFTNSTMYLEVTVSHLGSTSKSSTRIPIQFNIRKSACQ